MSTTTLAPRMPRDTPQDTVTGNLPLMEEPLRLKIFEVDHTTSADVQKIGSQVIRNLSVNEVLREAIHAGLPSVARKYEAMATAAKQTK